MVFFGVLKAETSMMGTIEEYKVLIRQTAA